MIAFDMKGQESMTAFQSKKARVAICLRLIVSTLIGIMGCSETTQTMQITEVATTLRLSSQYTLKLIPVAGDCAFGPFSTSSTSTFAEVRQTNADVVWDIFSIDEDGDKVGTPIRVAGRICDTESGAILKMRGTQIARIESEGTACRSAPWLPAASAECAEVADVCSDPGAFELTQDECTGRIVGAFRSCFTFQESCFGQPPCRLGLQ